MAGLGGGAARRERYSQWDSDRLVCNSQLTRRVIYKSTPNAMSIICRAFHRKNRIALVYFVHFAFRNSFWFTRKGIIVPCENVFVQSPLMKTFIYEGVPKAERRITSFRGSTFWCRVFENICGEIECSKEYVWTLSVPRSYRRTLPSQGSSM